MDEKFKGHDHYSSRQVDFQSKELERDRDFVIRHYAGDVVLEVTFPYLYNTLIYIVYAQCMYTV